MKSKNKTAVRTNRVFTAMEQKLMHALKNLKWAKGDGSVGFNILASINRAITPNHVTKINISHSLLGSLRAVICVEVDFINGKLTRYILDGQHLYNSLLRLGWDIPYVVVDVKNKRELIEAIAMLNASSKTWCTQDYVTAWSSLIEDYVKLNQYFDRYDMEILFIADVLSNGNISDKNISRKIKNGEFKILDEANNVKILDYVTSMLKVVPRMNRYENRYACQEYVKFLRGVRNYDDKKHAKFITNLKKNKQKFILATQEEGKLSDLFRRICLN